MIHLVNNTNILRKTPEMLTCMLKESFFKSLSKSKGNLWYKDKIKYEFCSSPSMPQLVTFIYCRNIYIITIGETRNVELTRPSFEPWNKNCDPVSKCQKYRILRFSLRFQSWHFVRVNMLLKQFCFENERWLKLIDIVPIYFSFN